MKYKVRNEYKFIAKGNRYIPAGEVIDDKEHNVAGQLHKLEAIPEVKDESKPSTGSTQSNAKPAASINETAKPNGAGKEAGK